MSSDRTRTIRRTASTFLACFLGFAVLASAQFRRGDANNDGIVNNDDADHIIDSVLISGDPLDCDDAGDANDDGLLDLSDAIFVLNFINLNGPRPPVPGPYECDVDPTADSLGCADYSAPCTNFRRGDVDDDGDVDEYDADYLQDALFEPGGPSLGCLDAADANDTDDDLTIADISAISTYSAGSGPIPADPGPADCGPDPTEDSLGCATYTAACNEFLRGDANSDGVVTSADGQFILDFVLSTPGFTGTITCDDAADANDDGQINIADGIFLLRYDGGEGSGSPPPFPGPTEGGRDVLTPDELGCESP